MSRTATTIEQGKKLLELGLDPKVEQALTEVKNKMQAQDNKPITKEQLIGMWLDEKGSISLSEQVALGFAYDKLSVYLQTKEE